MDELITCSRILNSKLYKGSKRKESILSAMSAINTPLAVQLKSYLSEESKREVDQAKFDQEVKDEEIQDLAEDIANEESGEVPSGESSSSFGGGHSSSPMSFTPSHGGGGSHMSSGDLADSSEPDLGDTPDLDIDTSEPESEHAAEDVEESTTSNLENQKPVVSNTFVSINHVAQDVSEIPGLLNLKDETKGVINATIKGGPDSTVWIYYDNDVDISKILDKVISTLNLSGYFYLDFNRIARDQNAVVFDINWVSNYFKPEQVTSEEK